jgi:hypothetical protein
MYQTYAPNENSKTDEEEKEGKKLQETYFISKVMPAALKNVKDVHN